MFFNYTDFVVSYDEGQYIPIFKIQLIYKVNFFNNMLYKLHTVSKLNTNSYKTVIKEYPSNDIQKSCII